MVIRWVTSALGAVAVSYSKSVMCIVASARSGNEDKASIVVGVTDDLTDRLSAIDLVRAGAEALGGKGGGGRPDMAEAGDKDPANLPAALAAAETEVEQRLQG